MTLDRPKPLTYEMAVKPEQIGTHKSFNSFNTGQLEDTYGLDKEEVRGGPTLSKHFIMIVMKIFIF